MKLKVGVFFGGESVEHEISIISASQAMAALDRDKYEVIPIYISKARDFYYGEALNYVENFANLETLFTKVKQVTFAKKDNKVLIIPVKQGLFSKPLNTLDIAIPVIHGTNGEDGTIQGYLEMLKIPYVGCNVCAAAVGQDKAIMKHVLQDAGLPLSPWFWIYAHDYEKLKSGIDKKAFDIGYPLVVKPANLGSSVGISIAHNAEELGKCIEDAGQYDFKVVIEKMVSNLREINASVIGDCFDAKVSVLEEVFKGDEILSYGDKYGGNAKGSKGAKSSGSKGMASTSRKVPADLTEEQEKKIKKLAINTFNILGASGVCRIDFMMDGVSGQILVNEINTIPGSLSFYLWESENVSFTELMDKLIQIALDRYRRQEKMIFSYDTNVLANYKKGEGTKGAKK